MFNFQFSYIVLSFATFAQSATNVLVTLTLSCPRGSPLTSKIVWHSTVKPINVSQSGRKGLTKIIIILTINIKREL